MPHLIDIIDAAIFLSPIVIMTVLFARYAMGRFAH